jgi:hypothetical protein
VSVPSKPSVSSKKNFSGVIAIISILVAFYPQLAWIIVFNRHRTNTQQEKVRYYLAWFPSFLQNSPFLPYCTLVFSVVGLVFSIIWNNNAKGFQRIFSVLILVISILLFLLTILNLCECIFSIQQS